MAWPKDKTRYKNPYTHLLYAHMPERVSILEFNPRQLLLERFDALHLHWPVETITRHPIFLVALIRSIVFCLLIWLSRKRGTKIVWTIHDKEPHSVLHLGLAYRVEDRLTRMTDAYINMCDEGHLHTAIALTKGDRKEGHIIPHGHYRGYYPNIVKPIVARRRLGLPENAEVFLFLGYISPYKNVPDLIKAFKELEKVAFNKYLVIAGLPDTPKLQAEIEALAKDCPSIILKLRFVADHELQIFYNACNVVVLPFAEVLNSGSLLLALSFDRPVLVPYQKSFSHWEAFGNWVKFYHGPLSLDDLLRGLYFPVPLQQLDGDPLSDRNWWEIARKTAKAYE